VSQDEGNVFLSAEIGEPLPGEEAFHGDHQSVPIGGNSLEEGFGSGFHLAVQQDFTVVAQDADVHASGMQIDTAVKWVLVSVKSHEVSSFLRNLVFPNISIPLG